MRLLKQLGAGAVGIEAPTSKASGASRLAALALLALSLAFLGSAPALAAAPAMITPGQFNVSQTGGFTYTVPIAVPPGTAGMVPALSLDYSSQSGDGLEGLGWTLNGLPSIGRCPQTIDQDPITKAMALTYTASDRFCMEGQRLVAISGTYGADGTVYRTEIEGFSDIVSHGSSGTGPAYFTVRTKAGQTMYFGLSDDGDNPSNNSRLELPEPGCTTPPVTCTARAWAVEKIVDVVGNYLIVKYVNDKTNGQAYPTEIDYTGNTRVTPDLVPYAQVLFNYTNRTTLSASYVPTPTYLAGYVKKTTKLLTNIQTKIGTTVVTNYNLLYNAASNGAEHFELKSVQQCDAASSCLKTTAFGWQGTKDTVAFTSPDPAWDMAQDLNIFPSDFNGDGLVDALVGHLDGVTNIPDCLVGVPIYEGGVSGLLSTIGGHVTGNPDANACTFSRPWRAFDIEPNGLADIFVLEHDWFGSDPPFTRENSYVAMTSSGFSFTRHIVASGSSAFAPDYPGGDFNGDGRSDYYVQDTTSYPYVGEGNGHFDRLLPGQTGLSTQPLVMGDFDGDGCTDVLGYGATSTLVYLCNPATSSTTTTVFSGKNITPADFNGDGITDVFATSGSSSTLYYGTGTGFAAASCTISPSINYNNYIIYTGDMNGDGKQDLVLISPSGGTDHQILLSTGDCFFQAQTITNSVASGTGITASVADYNNDGAADVWIQIPSSLGSDEQYLSNFVPEETNSVDNGLGVKTFVTYDRLNKNGDFYQKCDAPLVTLCGDEYPIVALDGALYLVSRIDASNGLGTCNVSTHANCYSSTYAYSQAKVDVGGRGFLGFGSMSVTDLQTHIVQKTTYFQGTSDEPSFPKTGLLLTQTKTCPAPRCGAEDLVLNETTNTYEKRYLGTSVDGVGRWFVGPKTTVVNSTDYDFNSHVKTVMPTATTTYTYDCYSGTTSICAGTSPTGFGNVTKVVQALSDGSSKTTTSTYDNDPVNWYLGRLTAADVRSIIPGVSDMTRHTSYTNGSVYGLLQSAIVEPQAATTSPLRLETGYNYDDFGNKDRVGVHGCVWTSDTSCSDSDPTSSRATATEYDATTLHAQFATKITNELDQFETWEYHDPRNSAFGVPSGHTGPNGLKTTWTYDEFGRVSLEHRPDDNETKTEYTYCTGLPDGTSCPTGAKFSVIVTPQHNSDSTITQNGPIVVTYYDGLSRVMAVDSQGFDAPGSGCATTTCWIRVTTQYDENGRVEKSSRPYFTSGGTAKWTTYTYDLIGRVTETTYPDSSHTTYGFAGLTTTVTNDLNQTTTTVKNAQGMVAQVTNTVGKVTAYVYDAFGDLKTITADSTGSSPIVTTYGYDIRGRKTSSNDPDMGNWTYQYDGFGELYKQTDAKGQVSTLTYDGLGRVKSRTEPDMTSTWVYDTASGAGIGQLASATTGSSYKRTLTYDTLGRTSDVALKIGATTRHYVLAYDSNSRLQTEGYPSGFTARHVYTALGYDYQVKDDGGTGVVFWTAKTRDAELHLLTQQAGSLATTTQTFDPNTGRLTAVDAGPSNSIAHLGFSYDTLGNLTNRTWKDDSATAHSEAACYDSLNRLTDTAVDPGTGGCTGGANHVGVTYSRFGTILEKTDVCNQSDDACMHYGAGAGPHAITSIQGTFDNLANPDFTYDANGNLTCISTAANCAGTVGRTASWTSFNMAAQISDGGNSIAYTYDSEHQRITQTQAGADAGTTTYLTNPVTGTLEELFTPSGGSAVARDYISAGGQLIALRSAIASVTASQWGDPTTKWGSFKWAPRELSYFIQDNLGSIAVITNSTGGVVQRLSYDAWGKRRNANGTAAACGAITSNTTDRGFTGQEMMDSVCTINFNARLYDPSLGRFLSADPVKGTVYNLQALDPYAYVFNNPLSLTDPSGMCVFGICTWFKNPLVSALLSIALFFVLPEIEVGLSLIPAGTGTAFAAANAAGLLAVNAGIAGGISGFAATGTLKGALLSAGSAAAMAGLVPGLSSGIAGIFGSATATTASTFVASGLIGGLSSLATGGNFGSGFLAAAVGSLAGPLTGGNPGEITPQGVLVSALLGGAAAVLGGGKFANGAVTGAFAYLVGNIARRVSPQPSGLATTPSLEGSEMASEARKAKIDEAIRIYRTKAGHADVLFSNRYDEYAVVSNQGGQRQFDTLAEANDFIASQPTDEWQHLLADSNTPGGIFPSPYITIYAGAAYSNINVYGATINPNFATLFVLWHESGHLPQYQGGGGCFAGYEACANKWAYDHYLK